MASEMLLGTQHHTQMVRPPLSGADMGSVGWGADGTYLSGGGFVRQSQDSHRTYIFEWSGARSVEEATYMQALRDGVYSKSRRDLIYFIDPNIYDKNILPKRWAQPGILAPDSGSAITPLGVVSKVDGPSGLGLPMTGAQVSSHFTSLAQFNATTEPQQGSIWVPVPPGKTLYVLAWTGNPDNSESGVYVRGQNLDGSWNPASLVEGIGFIGSGLRGVLVGTVGAFDFYAARAALDLPPSQGPVTYAWTGTPNASTSTRTTDEGTVTNLFTDPDMVSSSGMVEVWESQLRNSLTTDNVAPFSATRISLTDMGGFVRCTITDPSPWSGEQRFTLTASNDRLPVTGDPIRVTVEARAVQLAPDVQFYVRIIYYDSGGASLSFVAQSYAVTGEWQSLVLEDPSPPASAAKFGLWIGLGLSHNKQIGDIYDIRHAYEGMAPYFFDHSYSPDPDLTPTGTPGGTSAKLVGKPAGLTASNGVVVQSEQWSKSGGKSARLINNTGATNPYITFTPAGSSGETYMVWRYQDKEIPFVGTPSNISRIYVNNPRRHSDPAPNHEGDWLMRVDREDSTGDCVLYGGHPLGESVWFDLLTVTDTPGYEGEPFSGSTPDNLPEWSPGLGHSGCAFVGNPTWTATSGVNGGQVGYAATLKEVGDWQQ